MKNSFKIYLNLGGEKDDLHIDIKSSVGLWYVSKGWFAGRTFESCPRSKL